MQKQSLIRGTLVLFTSNFVNRILGFIYQISIVNLIGAQGIGLFNMVYPIYILVLVISSLGLPIAIAKFVAENNRSPNNSLVILKKTIYILVVFSISLTIFTLSILDKFAPLFLTNHAALPILKILLMAVPIVTICSCFRGFFQGLLLMNAPALSQFFEQLVRVILGLILANMLITKGVVWGAIGSALGLITGEASGFLLLLYFFYKWWQQNHLSSLPVNSTNLLSTKALLIFAWPVALGKIIATILLSIEATLIPRQLVKAGISLTEATVLYGQLSGMALPILVIPSVFTTALATTLVPAIAEASSTQNVYVIRERIKKSLLFTILTGLPAIVIYYFFSSQICYLLFKQVKAGEALRILSFGGIFYYLQQTTTGILQGLGQPKKPLENMLWGSIVEIIFLLLFVPAATNPFILSCWAINISFCITSTLNLINITKQVGILSLFESKIILTVPGTILMSLVAYHSFSFTFQLFNHLTFALLASLLLSLISYIILLIVFGVISASWIYQFLNYFFLRNK